MPKTFILVLFTEGPCRGRVKTRKVWSFGRCN